MYITRFLYCIQLKIIDRCVNIIWMNKSKLSYPSQPNNTFLRCVLFYTIALSSNVINIYVHCFQLYFYKNLAYVHTYSYTNFGYDKVRYLINFCNKLYRNVITYLAKISKFLFWLIRHVISKWFLECSSMKDFFADRDS